MGLGPVLGYAAAKQNVRANVLPLLLGAAGFSLGLGILSAVFWPVLVGWTSRRHRMGRLLLGSVLGCVAGSALVWAWLLTGRGQDPAWLQTGFWLWSLAWGVGASLGLASEKAPPPAQPDTSDAKERAIEARPEAVASPLPPSAVPEPLVAQVLERPDPGPEPAQPASVADTERAMPDTPVIAPDAMPEDEPPAEDIRPDPAPDADRGLPQPSVSDIPRETPPAPRAKTGDPAWAKPEVMTESLTNIAVESWRLKKVFDRMLAQIDAPKRKRFESRWRWYDRQVETELKKAGLQIVNLEGKPYDMGMAVTPLNIEDFDADEPDLVVEQMLQPIIMGPEGDLIKMGTVTLKRKE